MKRAVGKKIWHLLPTVGVCLFMVLYLMATLLYPGGSNANKTSVGFNWLHNYWCDLLGSIGKNGKPNPAQPLAMTAMAILCFVLATFWYSLPLLTPTKRTIRLLIQVTGTLSMLLMFFIYTPLHDVVINVAGSLGVVALCSTYLWLYQIREFRCLAVGLFNFFLGIINNYVYHSVEYLEYLPVIQKFSMISFLGWICWMNLSFYEIAHKQLEKKSIIDIGDR